METKVTRAMLEKYRAQIENALKSDEELSYKTRIYEDELGFVWLEVQYQYPAYFARFRKIGLHYNRSYASYCKDCILEDIHNYIINKGKGVVHCVVGGEADCDCGGDGNNPYAKTLGY